MEILDRFLALQALLADHDDLWRPRPFCDASPAWTARRPALAGAVAALDDPRVAALEAEPAALLEWLVGQLPSLGALAALTDVATLPVRALPPGGPHFDCGIPGRKRAQIEAFAAATPAPNAPLLEWCAGKGHLGRRFALADALPVTSLEIDATLCAEAARLAARAGVDQAPLCADALASTARAPVAGRHVLALHACGEMHRTLVRHAGGDGARGYSIAPCCYHLRVDGRYRPLSTHAGLPLSADEVRLAVTETVTAAPRERRRHQRERAYKLGFVALRSEAEGIGYRSFRPVPAAWSQFGFEGFCRALAAREALALPDAVDWDHWERIGATREATVRRHALVRHAFRRALELWLVGDLALALEAAGFSVGLGRFCERTLTPRNLLIHASRA